MQPGRVVSRDVESTGREVHRERRHAQLTYYMPTVRGVSSSQSSFYTLGTTCTTQWAWQFWSARAYTDLELSWSWSFPRSNFILREALFSLGMLHVGFLDITASRLPAASLNRITIWANGHAYTTFFVLEAV